MAFKHFLLGFHNFMVTAFGSCVKQPKVLPGPSDLMLNIYCLREIWMGLKQC